MYPLVLYFHIYLVFGKKKKVVLPLLNVKLEEQGILSILKNNQKHIKDFIWWKVGFNISGN